MRLQFQPLFFSSLISGLLYVFVALMWLVPDRRIERTLEEKEDGQSM